MLILFTLGCNFRVWSTILKQVKNPQSPSRNQNENSWSLQGGQNAPFSHSWLLLGGGGGGGGGKGSKSSIMIATLVKNRMKHPPPHPPENKDKTRESQNMAFIWGEMGWGGGELMTSFCLFCQKTALHKVENGKGHSTWGTLIRHGIRPLRGQTMQADSRLQNSQFFPRNRFFKIFPWSTQA